MFDPVACVHGPGAVDQQAQEEIRAGLNLPGNQHSWIAAEHNGGYPGSVELPATHAHPLGNIDQAEALKVLAHSMRIATQSPGIGSMSLRSTIESHNRLDQVKRLIRTDVDHPYAARATTSAGGFGVVGVENAVDLLLQLAVRDPFTEDDHFALIRCREAVLPHQLQQSRFRREHLLQPPSYRQKLLVGRIAEIRAEELQRLGNLRIPVAVTKPHPKRPEEAREA